MLIRFRVANYRSIRDEQELSLVRNARIAAHRRSSIDDPADTAAIDLSPVIALYGSNASGKSNLLRAIAFMSTAIRSSHVSWDPDGGTPLEPFRLNATHPNGPARFEIEAIIHGNRIQYGFTINTRQVLQEWLYAYPRGKRQVWFERDESQGEDKWYFNKNFPGRNKTIAEVTRSNSLFLSSAASHDHARILPIYHHLARHIRIADSGNVGSRKSFTLQQLEKRPEVVEQLRRLLKHADLGIRDLRVIHKEMSSEAKDTFTTVITTLQGESADNRRIREAIERAETVLELTHGCADGSPPVALPYDEESVGTQSLIALAGPIMQALRGDDVLLIDEIDTSLHPRLVAEIIKLFQSPESNPHGAQLIFSSHDTSLLGHLTTDEAALDRDQVWFIQKDWSGASELYPLTDFKPRQAENLERGYLQGRYGATPFVEFANILSTLQGATPLAHADVDSHE